MTIRQRRGGEAAQSDRGWIWFLCRCAAVPLWLAACAKIAPPPGGPPDAAPPVLVATRPDSIGVYPGFQGNVEFIFDETVSEGAQPNFGTGTGDLETKVILSPTSKVPRVGWERSRITIRPREGWRPNTVYRIELLPGITDLRHNSDRRAQVLTFTTGAPLPTDSLRGIVIDWGVRAVARQVTVEAVLLPDSLVYRSQTDSSGRFTIAPLPHGRYLLRAYADQNKDRLINGRELWDSLGAAPAPNADGVLWLAERDTLPPRLTSATYRDSLTVDLELSTPVDPGQSVDSSNVTIRLLPDSTLIGVASFRARPLDDTLIARARAVADSLRADSARRAHPDTGRQAAAPAAPPAVPPPAAGQARAPRAPPVDSTVIKLLAGRPVLNDRLVLRVTAPLVHERKYLVEIHGVRNLNGVAGTAVNGFTAPKAPPPPKPAADSTRSDTTAPRPRRQLPAAPSRP